MLLLMLFLTALALFALLWGGSLVAQGYFYSGPADRLPYRAAAAGLLVACFLTFWVWLDRKQPGKYGTFFEFEPYTTVTFDEFEAVRWRADPATMAPGKTLDLVKGPDGKPAETVVKVKRRDNNKSAAFVTPNGKDFLLQESGTMTGALILNLPGSPGPVRFDAAMKPARPEYASADRPFNEARGSRYIFGNQLGIVYVPSTGTVILALLINLFHFLFWFAAFWLILRFTVGHALLFAFVLGLTTMLVAMPLLFARG